MNDLEKYTLESIAKDSLYAEGLSQVSTIKYSFNIFQRYLQGNVLELGPAEGIMTKLLVDSNFDITAVEGSELFYEALRNKYPNITVYNCLFEEFETEDKFENIVLGHVLEHVEQPIEILKHISKFLTPNGKILAAVPNARSLHRQAAVIMGLLPQEDALNELDKHHGHRRVFNPESFRNIFNQAGLEIEVFGGYWLKPLSNGQIDKDWTPEMLHAFMQLGERYPDISGEIYVIASKKS